MSITHLLRGEMAAAMATALALGLLLLALRPLDRASTRNALVLLGLCAFAELADGVLASMGGSRAAAVAADVASVLVGLVLIRLGTIFAFRVALRSAGLEPARIVEDLVTAALYVGWAFLWLRLAGVELTGLVTASAVVTAVLAFSMQDTLGNVLGGLMLQFDRSIRVGDWMRVEQVSGRVLNIGWRHTAILTRDRETVIVPNGWLMRNRFTVLGARADASPAWRRWVRISVDLESSPGKVCTVLGDAVKNASIPGVCAEPAPDAVLMEIGPRVGNYAVRYWLGDLARDDATDSIVRAHLLAALQRNGMRIGVPYNEQLGLQDDDTRRAAENSRQRRERVQALERVELFASLSPEERDQLADHLLRAPFCAGDVMTRQGAVAHWLYLMVSGEAEVWHEHQGRRTRVGTLGPGSVFGEMGMMTGDPRAATVTASTDVECYRLDKAGFSSIIEARPDIAEEISHVLSARAADLALAETAERAPAAGDHRAIVDRVRRFFGLR